jgi:hypothetical protein
MLDLSYTEALERSPEPHVVLLGPVPCQGCGAWVEWAGVEWLAVATREAHRCEPFRAGQRWRDQAHLTPRSAGPLRLEPLPLPPALPWQFVVAVLAVVVLALATARWAL